MGANDPYLGGISPLFKDFPYTSNGNWLAHLYYQKFSCCIKGVVERGSFLLKGVDKGGWGGCRAPLPPPSPPAQFFIHVYVREGGN